MEIPFSFGGAHHPFKITWTIDSPEVLRQVHPFGESVVETSTNQYSIWLDGHNIGSSKISVKVELSPHAKQHFVGNHRVFEDTITITVEDKPGLIQPELTLSTIRMGPNAVLPLEFNLPRGEAEFFVRSSSIISVSPAGVLRSSSVEGVDTLGIKRSTAAGNESIFVPVVVCFFSFLIKKLFRWLLQPLWMLFPLRTWPPPTTTRFIICQLELFLL